MPPGGAGKSGAWGTGLIAADAAGMGKDAFVMKFREKSGFEEEHSGFIWEAAGLEGLYACSAPQKNPSLRGLRFAAGAFRAAQGKKGAAGRPHPEGSVVLSPDRHQAFGTSSRSGMVKVTVVPSPGTLSRS